MVERVKRVKRVKKVNANAKAKANNMIGKTCGKVSI